MALTFPDKQRWVATLEAIVNDGDAEAPATEQVGKCCCVMCLNNNGFFSKDAQYFIVIIR
jgi:hypothetical protein